MNKGKSYLKSSLFAVAIATSMFLFAPSTKAQTDVDVSVRDCAQLIQTVRGLVREFAPTKAIRQEAKQVANSIFSVCKDVARDDITLQAALAEVQNIINESDLDFDLDFDLIDIGTGGGSNDRSNKGGATRGQDRANEVRSTNGQNNNGSKGGKRP